MKRAALLTPAIGFYSFFLIALVSVCRLSLFQSAPGHDVFIGLAHFKKIFTDELFIQQLINTFIYVVLITAGQTGLALLIALAIRDISKVFRGASIFFLYIPTLTSGVIIRSVWRWVFAPSSDGLLNWILGTDVIWMLYRFPAIGAISTVLIVSHLGFYVIMFTVALTTIKKEIIDAARIDGAKQCQVRRFILVPMIRPMIALAVLLSAIGSFMVWETIKFMAPIAGAQNLMFSMYTTGFEVGNYGEASAKTIVLVLIIAMFAIAKRRVEYDRSR